MENSKRVNPIIAYYRVSTKHCASSWFGWQLGLKSTVEKALIGGFLKGTGVGGVVARRLIRIPPISPRRESQLKISPQIQSSQ